MNVLETERLILRRLSEGDAAFILQLVNEPPWLRFIGDRGVRTLEDVRGYIRKGPAEMYRRFGSGLLAHGKRNFGLQRIVAITSPDNATSMKLLEKLGFAFEQLLRLTEGEPEVKLFAHHA